MLFQKIVQWFLSLFAKKPVALPPKISEPPKKAEPADEAQPDDDAESDDDMIPASDVRPITLRSSAIIIGNSDEEVNAAPLTNASGEPMEIHEFIFSVRPTDVAIANYGRSGLFPSGGQFAVGLSVKDATDFGYAMTNGVIPLWGFGQARQLGQEERLQSILYSAQDLAVSSFLNGVYCWKLDHPLYIPPGAKIVPVTRSLGSFTGDAVIGITAIGKILPNTPSSRASYKMPWVCSYLSKSFDFDPAEEDTSSDNSLYNPFPDKPVTIERFVGRLHMLTNLTVTDGVTSSEQITVQDTSNFDDAFVGFANVPNNFYSRFLRIRMRDSVGNPIVREKTLFRSVFESATRTWECRHILPPRQFHKVDFYKESAGGATNTRPSRLQALVSSVGWREVSWKKV